VAPASSPRSAVIQRGMGFQPMGAVLGTDRWYSIDTSNRLSDLSVVR
jgi:hypothetical protein